ncbi:MAG: hypothetical protein M1831_005407 [Alyxoria varia]|nr:MAG: hypothetical protein M1831_005407 [Alyxoria varia]
MQRPGRLRSPTRSKQNSSNHDYTTSYGSSSDDSYGRMNSFSRSESGTSQTHYEDFTHTPSPKVLMDEYNLNGLDWEPPPQLQGRDPRRNAAASDPVAMHLLVETAVGDSSFYNVLSMQELDQLKKEEATITRRIPTLRRELQLETKVRDAAQSLGRLSGEKSSKGALPKGRGFEGLSGNDYAASAQKCENMALDLWKLERRQTELREKRLTHTAGVLQLDYEHRTGQSDLKRTNGWDGIDDWSDGFNLQRLAPGVLADTADGIMDIPGVSDHKTDAMLNDLWNVMIEQDAGRRGMARNGADNVEEFSHENFSDRVQNLCSRAATLEQQLRLESNKSTERADLIEQLQDTHDRNDASQKKLQETQSELMDLREAMDEARQEISHAKSSEQEMWSQMDTKTAQISKLEAEKEDFEADIARLQTELTVVRADLDGAYGTRAQRAAEGEEVKKKVEDLEQEKASAASRAELLQKELTELVTEHEALVKQGIDSEKEREGLEGQVDSLREKVEGLEVKLAEYRLKRLGKRGSGNSNDASTPGTTPGGASNRGDVGDSSMSMSVMRNEFKKMMRESRAESFKALKAEQEERRKLEAALRALKKEQGGGSAPPASPSTLSPPGKSGLSRNITTS